MTKFFANKKIKKFVQIGSCLEYGNIEAPQNEKQQGLPYSPYALAKLASTKFLLMLYDTKKFPTTILRLFQVYGPQQDQNRIFPQIIKGCLKNEKFPVSHGNQVRDFCFIDDVIRAIFLALLSKKTNGEIINIGSGKPQKIKQIIKKIRNIIGKGKPQFGKFKYREGENMELYPSIRKAFIKLKWKPKINFDEGLRIIIRSFS